ncbi:RNA polymerase sigma factor [Sphingomonas echinoides]|uniref:RNA polymerase sigma factor n=1 Tax=Sphingomonas echinoides TaxID=59803 RepID=A0ABU4PM18_9SPHN|nr:RNA polymerase sigma factor [Sphingomonas echinoides]MDX5985213.1 RNA polymerase sigma factor [Sphingomonas echinoides]
MGWLRDIDRWFMAEVLPHAAAYRAKAVHFCGRDEADDLVQEAYARVLKTPDFRAIVSARGFVLTIVHNLALERLRRANVVRIELLASLDMLDVADPAPDAFAVAAGRSDLQRLLQLIDSLPPQCARVLHMRKIQGMPPIAIAEALSISVSTVEKHIAKGLALVTKARRDSEAQVEEVCPAFPKARSSTLT